MLVSYGGTQTWQLRTGFSKFVQNISTNIWSLGKLKDLKLRKMSYLYISYNIIISWLYTLNGFRIIIIIFFLLRDSATQEYANKEKQRDRIPVQFKRLFCKWQSLFSTAK